MRHCFLYFFHVSCFCVISLPACFFSFRFVSLLLVVFCSVLFLFAYCCFFSLRQKRYQNEAKTELKWSQNGAKKHQKTPKTVPKCIPKPLLAPRSTLDGQKGAKIDQNSSQWSQNGAKMTLNGAKRAPKFMQKHLKNRCQNQYRKKS